MKKIYLDRPMKYFLLLSLNCSLFSFIHCSDDDSDKTATKDEGSYKTSADAHMCFAKCGHAASC